MSNELMEEILKRAEQMGLIEQEFYEKQSVANKFWESDFYSKNSKMLELDIEKDLGLIQCKELNNSLIDFVNSVIREVNLYDVFMFYIKLERVFRDKNNKVYTMQEVEQLIIDYYEKNNIEYKEYNFL